MLPLLSLVVVACADGPSADGSVTFDDPEAAPPAADLVINEFMASNGGTLRLPDESSPDWVEIYSAADAEVDLGGYFLSDDAERPAKTQIPDGTVIEPGGFLLFYASGDETLGPEHLGFGLSSEGEELVITDRWGRRLDWVRFGPQSQDIAVGRAVDGDRDADWRLALAGTPGGTNASGP